MKKIIVSFCMILALVSCNKNDDNNSSSNVDPIFSQPYTPLAEFSDLETATYRYVGNKIGDRPVGLVGAAAKCKGNDRLQIFVDRKVVIDSIVYYNYSYDSKKQDCELSFISPRVLKSNKLASPGNMNSKVEEFWFEEIIDKVDPSIITSKRKTKETYSGNIEIGFQAEYLRIEDHISDYNYTPAKEKVYLYFKKM